ALPLAEFLHCELTVATILGPQAAGAVVDPRMQHPRVVPGLVASQAGLLLEQDDVQIGKPLCEAVSGRQSDDTAPHDGHVRPHHRSPEICRSWIVPPAAARFPQIPT